ncbi:hypothetical protein PNQ29_09285 [Halobacterium salinarum]|uniref:HVO-0234-like beta-propeller domain-containing protein n=13 Tax=Halobacterium salinarum TaxID=2242 RepID=Q9HN87_HALSA|nr:hypothetical protein [Halobacterium salinarum]AAG20334.1 hypothetical protein VNG_2204H [Halobacterium salinarum NRC-1]MBB6089741.1 hypothetical protein [Halobacterium salinarum]MDL0119922.1 hypothetical protein [Halobacterium salinarum]MDL0129540.1 hypothetical protein [Halobacterium salinarum]QCC45824.1 uncharacterized protein HBSAL_10910 [Halobacterium salinarum]
MPAIRDDHVFVEDTDAHVAYIAAGLGITAAHIGASTVGEFALEHRCDARDVAATRLGVAAATADGVVLSTAPPDSSFADIGFPAAVAVTGFDGTVLAADEDGRIAQYDPDAGAWTDRAVLTDATVRALDADLVAATDGVHRLTDAGLADAGLDDAYDVSAPGVPHAATSEGLFALGNGWREAATGAFRTVAADPASAAPGATGVAHAATPEACFEHRTDAWQPCRDIAPSDAARVVDATYAVDTTILLTAAGTLIVVDGDGDARHRSLGLPDAAAVTVVGHTPDR